MRRNKNSLSAEPDKYDHDEITLGNRSLCEIGFTLDKITIEYTAVNLEEAYEALPPNRFWPTWAFLKVQSSK